jgi:hypothetical protein
VFYGSYQISGVEEKPAMKQNCNYHQLNKKGKNSSNNNCNQHHSEGAAISDG